MKNLFKKKKSDTKLAPQPIQYDMTPKKPIVLSDTPLQAPPLMMPKPKRALTPTRAILGRFDNDKTEVEDSPLQDISPILLPTAHHDSNPPPASKSLQQHLSALSVTGSDDSSRIYESAVESPSTRSASREEVMDLPEFPPEAALAQKKLEMQQKLKEHQLEQQKKLEQQKEIEKQQEVMKQIEFKRQQELARQQQELERQQELKRQQEIEKQQQQQELKRQQEFEKQQQQQQEIERQNELERQGYIKRQKQLELEHIKTQLQFQESQYHEQQFDQQRQQFLQQQAQSGISDASSRTVSPSQRHHQMSSASSATATPMIKGMTPQATEEQEILFELKRQLDKMERQRAKDREEWRRKEEELMNQSNQMMEKLKETEGQLTMALKHEEEIRRVPYRSRSEEQIKQRRSVSRSSYHHHPKGGAPAYTDGHHHHHQQEIYQDPDEYPPQEYPPQDYYPEYPKESLSRRSSNASHRSRRSRSKSIESRRMDTDEEVAYSRPHPRRSRSAGRPSVKSPAAVPMYYDEYDDPRYYQQGDPYYNRADMISSGYYRHYGYPADYYTQQPHSMRPAMAPSRSTQSRGYPGYYFR